MKPGDVGEHGFVEHRRAFLGEGSDVRMFEAFVCRGTLDGRFDDGFIRREALRGDVVRLADESERGGARGRRLLPRELRPRLHLFLVRFKIRASLQTRERLLDNEHERLEALAQRLDDGVGHVADALGVATVNGDAARLRGAPRHPQRARQILDDRFITGRRRRPFLNERVDVGLDLRRRVPRSRLDRVAYPRVRVPRAFHRFERAPRRPQHAADARLRHLFRIGSTVEPPRPSLARVHGGVEVQPAQTLRLADERLGDRELLVDGLAQRGGGRDGARDPRVLDGTNPGGPVEVPVVVGVVGGPANGRNGRNGRARIVTLRRGEDRRASLARLPVPADEPVEPGHRAARAGSIIRTAGTRNRRGGSRQTNQAVPLEVPVPSPAFGEEGVARGAGVDVRATRARRHAGESGAEIPRPIDGAGENLQVRQQREMPGARGRALHDGVPPDAVRVLELVPRGIAVKPTVGLGRHERRRHVLRVRL